MVGPFNVEEIFPDIAHDSVRLPRRQTGNSPQGLAVTLIADYTVYTRAWLPTTAIVALLNEFDITTGAARTAISRLTRRGVLEGNRHGRHSFYRLTQPAATDLSTGGTVIATYATQSDTWDGTWTLIAFTLPKEERNQRNQLRTNLRWRGYAPLYDGVWISPRPLTARTQTELAALTPGAMTAFRAEHLALQATAVRNPIQAWNLPAIASHYENFIHRWNQLLPHIRAGHITGPAAVRARTEVMDTYRRFPTLDPQLPTQLMPPNWPRNHARELFTAVYDELAQPAEDHVRAVVTAVTNQPHPDIRAHTVADLGAPGTVAPRRAEVW